MRSVDVREYLALLKDGIPEVKNELPPGSVSPFGSNTAVSKDIIVVDAHRTFMMDPQFTKQVPFEKIVRVLSAFHRKIRTYKTRNPLFMICPENTLLWPSFTLYSVFKVFKW